MCQVDIACDPMHEPWTVGDCTAFCVSDLDTDDGICKQQYVDLWLCVGALSCPDYLRWVYGPSPLPCTEQVDAIDSCEAAVHAPAGDGEQPHEAGID